jgi:hypothetical protein
MITRMIRLTIITGILALTMTACECDISLYSPVTGCPDGWYQCCSSGDESDCEDVGSSKGHWTCCNNSECVGTGGDDS